MASMHYSANEASDDRLPAPPKAAKLPSSRQASGGDGLRASSSRCRRSPRVTDSPACCWEAPFSPTDSAEEPFFFIAPSPRAHLDLLGRLSRLLARGPLHDLLTKGAKDEELFAAISAADRLTMNGPGPEVKT